MIINKGDLITFNISKIKWDFDDIDGEEPCLPCSITAQFRLWEEAHICHSVNDDEYEVTKTEIEDFISDWLSDSYGFCHKGFKLDYAKPKDAH